MSAKRAFISVFNKEGIVDFAKKLQQCHGYELISTGGTFDKLKAAGLEVKGISEITGFRELIHGKVKSLHPKIHAGILCDRSAQDEVEELKENGIDYIDMVIVDLYPEEIDIGGVTLLRAASKNYAHVTPVFSSEQYETILEELDQNNGQTTYELRKNLAKETFQYTAAYDADISKRLFEDEGLLPKRLVLCLDKVKDLRYGENPHQAAAIYKKPSDIPYEVLQGKEISYNNMVDIASAVGIIREFVDVPAACVIKHNNPCGAAVGDNIYDAYIKAHSCDPISAFGGIIGLNQKVTEDIAKHASQMFLEVIVAPEFSDEALEILSKKKNLRLVKLPIYENNRQYTIKDTPYGTLVQEVDRGEFSRDNFNIPTKAKPTEQNIEDIVFAWKIAKHVSSNAIVIAKGLKTIGLGIGQTSRIASMEIALNQACEETKDAVVASDGFFPAIDNIHAAAQARIGAIIQPGGSIKDPDVIAEADKYNIPMVMTGIRHFKH